MLMTVFKHILHDQLELSVVSRGSVSATTTPKFKLNLFYFDKNTDMNHSSVPVATGLIFIIMVFRECPSPPKVFHCTPAAWGEGPHV